MHDRRGRGIRYLWIIASFLALFVLGYYVASARAVSPATAVTSPRSHRAIRPSVVDLPRVRRPQAIRGRVVSTLGMPLKGARVCAVCASCDISFSSPGYCAFSEVSGDFALHDVAPGRFVITAALSGYEVAAANGGNPVQMRPFADVSGLKIQLAGREPSLTGVVLDASGGPIAEAKVQVARAQYSVRPLVELVTDEQGRFSASLPAGVFAIRADAPGYAPGIIYRTLPTSDAKLLLTPASSIEGTVVDGITGEGVAGVDVRPMGSLGAALLAPVRSEADGTFLISGLEPGRYQLSAEGDHHRGLSKGVRVELGTRVTDVVVTVTSGVAVTGKVLVAASGEPCEEGYVALGPRNPFSLVANLEASETTPVVAQETKESTPSALAQIEPTGSVRLRGLTPGRYYVTLNCREYAFEAGPMVLDIRDQDQEVTWTVSKHLSLIVHVKDEKGNAVPYANVSLELPAHGVGGTVAQPLNVDQDGEARLEGSLYPGHYVITPHASYGLAPIGVELLADKGPVEVTVTIPGSSSVRVEVRTPDGRSIDDVQVLARAQAASEGSNVPSGLLRRAVSLGGGAFLLRPLPQGEFAVEVLDGVNPPFKVRGRGGELVHVEPGAEIVLKATLQCQAQLNGVVIDDGGAPVPDVWVSASQPEHRERDEGTSLGMVAPTRVLSDAQGSFSLGGLCSDLSYRVHAQHEGGASGDLSEVRPQNGLRVLLKRHGSLEGFVVSPDGQPVKDFVLNWRHIATHQTQGVRIQASDGRFRLDDLPAGPSSIDVGAGNLSGTMNIVIPEGKSPRSVTVTLEPAPAEHERDSQG